VASFWSKRINTKLKHDVAKDLGVEEEKIQELINGERHVGGETMDRVLKSIQENEENGTAKELAILDWYNNTDLKDLRSRWGYGQTELARKLEINVSTLNAIESKYHERKSVSKLMKKLYDFYQDEFNKQISKSKPGQKSNETSIVITDETLDKISGFIGSPENFYAKLEEAKEETAEYIVIKIDREGNIMYSENGEIISNITELHLDKIGEEKPVLDIKLRRLF